MAVINRTMPRKDAAKSPSGIGSVRGLFHAAIVGGVELEGLKEWSVDELSYSAGTTAQFTAKILDKDWIAESQKHETLPIVIKTTMTIDDEFVFSEAEEFAGVLDEVEYKPAQGVYTFHASSYARILVTEKISETVAGTANANKFTGQLVQELTARYGKGLKCVIDKAFMSKTKVGKVYKQQMTKTIMNMPVWDLFQSFANVDHADLFVKGDTLYYVQKPVDASPDITELGPVKPSYVFEFGKNILDVTVHHAAMFSHDVTVTVKSYQPRTQLSYESVKNMSDIKVNAMVKKLEIAKERDSFDAMNTASIDRFADRVPATPPKLKAGQKPKGREVSGEAQVARISKKENFTFVVANATQEDCERIAEAIMRDISRKEYVVTLKVLCQPDFNPRQYIELRGLSENAANQAYAIKSIHKSSGVSDGEGAQGYIAEFTLVNHAVQTQGSTLGL